MGNRSDAVCSICLIKYISSQGESVVIIPCGHVFHLNCINTWLKVRNACPLCGKRADLTSRVYLSYSSAPEVGLGGSSNSVEGTTVTENTSHRGTRTDISTLRLEAFIRQEIHKQNTEQTEIIMKRIKSLIDPLINQVARLSKKYHSASLNDQFSNLSTRVNDYQRSDSTTHNDTQQPSQRGVGWIVRSTTNEETDIHSRVQSEDIRDSRTLNSRGSRGPVRGRN